MNWNMFQFSKNWPASAFTLFCIEVQKLHHH